MSKIACWLVVTQCVTAEFSRDGNFTAKAKSIYDLLDEHLLPLDQSKVLIGCVGENCTGDISHEGTKHSGEGVLRRSYDVHTSFIQPMNAIFNVIDDEERLQHHSWQICRIGFDDPPPTGNCTWRDVADGKYDGSLLIPAAQHILTNLTRPIVLAICNEMPSKSYTRDCGARDCSDDYKDMYMHIRDVFASQNVTSKHVIWSWNTFNMPNVTHGGKFGNETWEKWFVGEENVDWVGINAFTGDSTPPDPPQWKTAGQLYQLFYQWVSVQCS